MKHKPSITFLIILLFVLSQLVGLFIVDQYISTEEYEELPYDMQRPELDQNYAFIYIMVGVLLGTVLLLTLIKFKKSNLWKIWYALAVVIALSIAFATFIDESLAIILALVFAVFKILKPNIIIHNISEVLLYGGIAAIFVPILNIFSASMLLIAISLYDMYAVWKSKHMITLANFQRDSKLFAGLSIPYKGKPSAKKVSTGKATSAILGGGDIAFPLLFTGTVMANLAFKSVQQYFLLSLIITLTTTIALGLLFYFSKKGKFYPAMPFVSAGCFVGYVLLNATF